MKDYQKLYSYLAYFEKVSKEEKDPSGKPPFVLELNPLYTTYTREMMNFAKAFYEVDFIDYSYAETLKEFEINGMDDMVQKIPTADERLLKAILTKIVRDERFTSGAWISYMEKGLFIKVVRRIGELYSQ